MRISDWSSDVCSSDLDRLDPDGGALLVLHPVLIVVEAAVALRQAEAARVLVREAGEADTRRVAEGAPDPLARTGPHRQPVGIVHLRPPVDHGRLRRLRGPNGRAPVLNSSH